MRCVHARGEHNPNDGDKDRDGIPDFADGYNLDGSSTSNADNILPGRFTPITVRRPRGISNSIPVRFKFVYDESNPGNVLTPDTSPNGIYEMADEGHLRIWNAPGGLRQLVHFVPSGSVQFAQTTYWVEAVRPSTGIGSDRILVYLDPDADGPLGFVLSDAIRLTALRGDIDIDSDNTNDADPERSDDEEKHENDPKAPGKIVVVNDSDKDVDGTPDLGDWEVGSGKFVPVKIQLPDAFDPSKMTLKIDYDSSDPRDGESQGAAGYAPGKGMFRLWKKDQWQARNEASVLDGGDFVPTIRTVPASGSLPAYTEPFYFEGADVEKLGFVGSTRTVTLFLEAVSAGTGTITITGFDRGYSVWSVGDSRLGETYGRELFSDTVKVTSIAGFADEAYGQTVRGADGALLYSEADLSSNGGVPFGVSRTFTSAPELLLANARGGGVAEWPKLIQGTSTVIAIVGTQAVFFDATGETYTARYGSHDKLTKVTADGETYFVLGSDDGTRIEFNGFGEQVEPAQRGLFRKLINAAGMEARVTLVDSEGRIEAVETDSGTTLTATRTTSLTTRGWATLGTRSGARKSLGLQDKSRTHGASSGPAGASV